MYGIKYLKKKIVKGIKLIDNELLDKKIIIIIEAETDTKSEE